MVLIWSKRSEQGTWTPFDIPMFGELNSLRNQYELASLDRPLIRELTLNGKRLWLHPDITETMFGDQYKAREWAKMVVREELHERAVLQTKAHPVHDVQDTEQNECVVEHDAPDVQRAARVRNPLRFIDIEETK